MKRWIDMIMVRRLQRGRTPRLNGGVWRIFTFAVGVWIFLALSILLCLREVDVGRAAVSRARLVQHHLTKLGEDLAYAEAGDRGYLFTEHRSYLAAYRTGLRGATASLKVLMEERPDAFSRVTLDGLQLVVTAKLQELDRTVTLVAAGETPAAVQILLAGDNGLAVDRFRALQLRMADAQGLRVDAQQQRVNATLAVVAVILIGGGGAAIYLLYVHTRRTLRGMVAPMRSLTDAMLTVSTGSAERRLTVDRTDEIGAMTAAFNAMSERLCSARIAEEEAIEALRISHETMRVSRSFLTRTGAVAGVGGWEINLTDGGITWSDVTRQLTEVDPGFVPTFHNGFSLYTDACRPIIEKALQEGIALAKPWDLELEMITAKGRRMWVRCAGLAEFEEGAAVRIVGVLQDISERRRLEQALADSHELLRVTLECIGDGVITTDQDGVVKWLNPVAESMTGWTKDDAQSHDIGDVFNAVQTATGEVRANPIAACLQDERTVVSQTHTTLVSREGREYGIEDSAAPIRNAQGQTLGAVLVFHDVTEQRRLALEMTHRAVHDSLTGLINRAEFENRLATLLQATDPKIRAHVVMFVDLDEFKVVNDACGHAAGDTLLQQVSVVLQANVRSRDTVARLGGDEFGIILEDCSLERGQVIAQSMCEHLNVYRFVNEGRRYRIGASIGVVPVDERWNGPAAILKAADACCYAAKEEGRNRVHSWADADGTVTLHRGEMQWVNRLEVALDEDLFELFAQQIQPMDGSRTRLHCEILLRLRETDGSYALPGAFYPAAERFHLASRLDRWVLNRVFKLLRGQDVSLEGIETIAINLSGQSISDREFHRDLISQLHSAPFDLRKICFEITETVAITHLGNAKLFIEEVRALGVKIALDDFGAGASSFGYLRVLPVDYIKIDGQYVTRLLEDPLAHAAVRCFCEVAKIMGVKTIAEFVERSSTRDALLVLGVDMTQGYLIHRPEPLTAMLRARPRRAPRPSSLERLGISGGAITKTSSANR